MRGIEGHPGQDADLTAVTQLQPIALTLGTFTVPNHQAAAQHAVRIDLQRHPPIGRHPVAGERGEILRRSRRRGRALPLILPRDPGLLPDLIEEKNAIGRTALGREGRLRRAAALPLVARIERPNPAEHQIAELTGVLAQGGPFGRQLALKLRQALVAQKHQLGQLNRVEGRGQILDLPLQRRVLIGLVVDLQIVAVEGRQIDLMIALAAVTAAGPGHDLVEMGLGILEVVGPFVGSPPADALDQQIHGRLHHGPQPFAGRRRQDGVDDA
ncbi:hypothetical protein D3C87_1063080 [compost metagenome]